jgi:CheY-like chemotaxis protein
MGIALMQANPSNLNLRRLPPMKPRILIVDDDEAITQQLFWTLNEDYDVVTANDMQTAIRRVTVYQPAVSLLDLHLPPEVDSPKVGLRILDYIKTHFPDSKVLVMTSAGGESSIAVFPSRRVYPGIHQRPRHNKLSGFQCRLPKS